MKNLFKKYGVNVIAVVISYFILFFHPSGKIDKWSISYSNNYLQNVCTYYDLNKNIRGKFSDKRRQSKDQAVNELAHDCAGIVSQPDESG